MKTLNLRQLKANPSAALHAARSGMVLVMSRDRPEAVLIGFEQLDGLVGFQHGKRLGVAS